MSDGELEGMDNHVRAVRFQVDQVLHRLAGMIRDPLGYRACLSELGLDELSQEYWFIAELEQALRDSGSAVALLAHNHLVDLKLAVEARAKAQEANIGACPREGNIEVATAVCRNLEAAEWPLLN